MVPLGPLESLPSLPEPPFAGAEAQQVARAVPFFTRRGSEWGLWTRKDAHKHTCTHTRACACTESSGKIHPRESQSAPRGRIMSVFLLLSYCLSITCDFSVVNMHCSYDRKIQLKAAETVAVGAEAPEGAGWAEGMGWWGAAVGKESGEGCWASGATRVSGEHTQDFELRYVPPVQLMFSVPGHCGLFAC